MCQFRTIDEYDQYYFSTEPETHYCDQCGGQFQEVQTSPLWDDEKVCDDCYQLHLTAKTENDAIPAIND